MNVELVEVAAMAVASWLAPSSTVVIGRDARYGSEDFANVSARVLMAAGHRVRMFADVVPTPIVAYWVGSTDAAAGIMVTASHNPASDNGYKVYTADGGQLQPGDAATIEATMALLPWPETVDATMPTEVELLGQDEVDAYVATVAEAVSKLRTSDAGISVAYTAMHGVGGELFQAVLSAGGHVVHSVPEQHDPDPDFPTAPFPNPEESGTLDLVMALADEVDADIVLANDPDADRLAVAVKGASGWERLTGDQIGVLLGWYVLGTEGKPQTVASSVVSSTLLSKVAAAVGAAHGSTLTGFKWLARAGSDSAPLVFAYEEALGYSVAPEIRDKDGISAGLAFANLVAWLKVDGRSVVDVLAEIGEEHGHHLTAQVSVRFEGSDPMADMSAAMNGLRERAPEHIGELAVVGFDDLSVADGDRVASDVLIFLLDGGRLIVRPSGTEPKIKAYLEVVDGDVSQASERLRRLEAATRTLLLA